MRNSMPHWASTSVGRQHEWKRRSQRRTTVKWRHPFADSRKTVRFRTAARLCGGTYGGEPSKRRAHWLGMTSFISKSPWMVGERRWTTVSPRRRRGATAVWPWTSTTSSCGAPTATCNAAGPPSTLVPPPHLPIASPPRPWPLSRLRLWSRLPLLRLGLPLLPATDLNPPSGALKRVRNCGRFGRCRQPERSANASSWVICIGPIVATPQGVFCQRDKWYLHENPFPRRFRPWLGASFAYERHRFLGRHDVFSIFERSKQVFVSDGLQFRVRLIVNSTPSKLDR